MSFAGKVALITGGTKGIGKTTAQTLAKQGAKIAVNYNSDSSLAEALVAELGKDNCIAIQGDAGDVAAIERMVASTVQAFGKIDILIPNAGALIMKDLEGTTEAEFDSLFKINVKGPFFLAQKAVPHMPSGGRVVFLSTSQCQASTVGPAYLPYICTKGAIEQMVRGLSKDLARKGIAVNAIAPGPTGTELYYRGKSQEVLDFIAGLSPFKRIGETQEIANAIAFMCSPEGTWVSGQVLPVNGAMA